MEVQRSLEGHYKVAEIGKGNRSDSEPRNAVRTLSIAMSLQSLIIFIAISFPLPSYQEWLITISS